MSGTRALAGVDGCRGGWIAALERPGEACALLVAPRFADLLAALPADAILAVDMPIGLPERIDGAGRAAEIAARPLLTPGRRSSLFSIPARAAVEAGAGPFADAAARADAYRRVCARAREASEPPRAVSIQGFGLFPRILELDALLRAEPALARRVFESHPEIAFARLNGGEAMRHSKKRGGRVHEEGAAERRRLLMAKGLPPELLSAALPRGAGEDDRLDACVLLLVARRLARGEATSLPDPPERDGFGLPVAIWA
ncbi:DUF429 domain-containing protein [Aureimonas sp. AU20]|uniref:DUF429 domain-containing protein n=1 Tax=Aureimonas sp. AU20 TaxID=1349819 RepID=UPI000720C1D5|nr:DUF429 domain-containing protein [Aureimonas sp. AU20]ALN71550.1 hypothetical protein M673_02425 [Aureimonas sp. AU20]